MTQAAAGKALDGFLAAAIGRGQRCLLVVTGKGRGGDGSGVLRRRLPAWLEASGHRRAILALAPARPQHGGSGAFYLLLRRQREDRSGPTERR
ncbi:MAG: Smr/MutS family protein [Kiloniellales bacterium]